MLKHNLIANYLGQGWAALMSLSFIPLYIKYLGIEAYGLIGLFAVLQAWLGLLDMGMTPTLSREMARFTGGSRSAESIRDLLRTIEVIALGIALLMATGIALASNWIANSWLKAEDLPTETVAHAFAIMGLVTALRFMEGIYRSTIVGLQKQVLFNLVSSVIATLRGLGAVGILIWVSPTIEAFFIWQGVVSVIALMTLGFITYQAISPGNRSAQFSLVELRGVWRFAGGMMGGAITGLLINGLDKIFISKFLTLSELGYYTLVTSIVSLLGILQGPVNQAVYPHLTELLAKNERAVFLETFIKASKFTTIVLGSVSLVVIFFPNEIIYSWTGDIKLATKIAPCLSLISLASLIASPVSMLYQTQIACGNTRIGIQVNILTILFTIPGFMVMIPWHGLTGAASVLIAAACVALIQQSYYTFTSITPGFRLWATQSILKPLAVALAIVLCGRYLISFPETRLTSALILILIISTVLTTSMLTAHRNNFKIGQVLSVSKNET